MYTIIFVFFWWSLGGKRFVPLPARTLSLSPTVGLPQQALRHDALGPSGRREAWESASGLLCRDSINI